MDKNFKLSEYQENILEYVKTKPGNLLVDAKAGSGKTSTLLLIADAIKDKGKKCMFLAFNKSIVEELKLRVDTENCDVRTLHSLGYTFLRSYLYRLHKDQFKLEIDTGKMKGIIKPLFEEMCLENVRRANEDELDDEGIKNLCNEIIRDLDTLTQFSRHKCVNYHEKEQLDRLVDLHCNRLSEYSEIGMNNYYEVIEKAIDKEKELFENPPIDEYDKKPIYVIDYTDQIYLPTYYNMFTPFKLKPYTDFILVDEAQDLTVLQQRFIKRLNNQGVTRYIFVGDAKQAIYAFAGADCLSVQNIKRNFTLTELPLNICYRCPENVIKIAKSIVPSIEWNKAREDKGVVATIDQKSMYDILQPGDMIIGRRNKDLVKLYKHLCLDQKIPVKFKNTSLVTSLINDFEECIKQYIKRYNKFENIDRELYAFTDGQKIPRERKLRNKAQQELVNKKANEIMKARKALGKTINKSNHSISYLVTCMNEFVTEGAYEFIPTEDPLREYYEIILSFIEEFKKGHNAVTVKSFMNYVSDFLHANMDKPVPIISSVHMMKGGEADNVFILDYPYFPYQRDYLTPDQNIQEENLQYVAITRAKKKLYLVLVNNPEDSDIITKKNAECESLISLLLK